MKVPIIISMCLISGAVALTQAQEVRLPSMEVSMASVDSGMKTFLIERNMEGIGASTLTDLQNASKKSCTILGEMGEGIEWVTSYVTQDKIFCVYKASDKALIEKHAEISGFPANAIHEVAASFVKPPK